MFVLRLLLSVLACLALAGPAHAAATRAGNGHAAPPATTHAHAAPAHVTHGVEGHTRTAHAQPAHAHETRQAATRADDAATACPGGAGGGHGAHAAHADAGDTVHSCCHPAAADCVGHCAGVVPALPASAPAGRWNLPCGPPVARLRGAHLAPPPAPLLRPPIA